MTVTIEEVNAMYRGIVNALEKIGFHPNPLEKPIYWDDSKTNYGTTHRDWKNGKEKFYIHLSKFLVEAEKDPFILYDVIAHETCHTIDGCFNHTGLWKYISTKFNKVYGTHISRTTRIPDAVADSSRYVLQCPKCGCRIGYHRMCNAIKHPEQYECRTCKVDLVRIL